MSRRARLWESARDAKYLPHDLCDVTDEDGGDCGPLYTCPGCGKNRSEPFHCTPCNTQAEAPGWED